MINFANSIYLYLLLLIPIMAIIYIYSRCRQRKKMMRFGNMATIKDLMPDVSMYKPRIKIILRLIALFAIIIVLTRPQSGEKEIATSLNGIEVIVAVDVSNSMLASSTDDINGISRLERTKIVLGQLLDRLDNNKVGLIVFAGNAYTQLPLTPDSKAAKMYINTISTDMVGTQGTAISDAVSMAMNLYSTDKDVHKAMIIITDCEDHQGQAIEMATNAKDQGIQVNVIGVGTANGALIPTGNKGEFFTYNGELVRTALNENVAKSIADAGGGKYVSASDNSAIDKISEQLALLGRSELSSAKYKASAEQFPIFAWIALAFLIIDIFVLDRKVSWLKGVNIFNLKK